MPLSQFKSMWCSNRHKLFTLSIFRDTIWNIRLKRLEDQILEKWEKFTIWNAGKQGRKLYNSLRPENREKVLALCDIDENKIGKKYVTFDGKTRKTGRTLDIIHYREAEPPFVICVKMV